MASRLRIDRIRPAPTRGSRWRAVARRETAFWLAVFHLLRMRLLGLVLILAVGTVFFLSFERHQLSEAVFYTWSLIFGEVPDRFPVAIPLQVLYFVLPVIGLLVIVEGLVEFALLVRDRRRSERTWCKIMANGMKNHIVLVGVGRLGYRTYTLLHRLGAEVIVLELDGTNRFLEEVRRHGTPILIGDARRESLLEDANIAEAKSIVLATTNDLANLEIALDARALNPRIRVVLRMFDQTMADKIRDGFNIHIAMSQSALAAPTFAVKAIEPEIESSMVVEDELVVTIRWHVHAGGPIAGRTVADAMRNLHCAIVERRDAAGKATLFPGPETRLEAGDDLLVQGAYAQLSALRSKG